MIRVFVFAVNGKRVFEIQQRKIGNWGSGCGSVGKAVTSDTRGPRFESHHRKSFIEHCKLSTVLKRRK